MAFSNVPKQLSNLTLPYYMEHFGPGDSGPVVYCSSQAISKNLTDPASVLLFLSVPTSALPYCPTEPATTRWYLLHSSDGSATVPVDLPVRMLFENSSLARLSAAVEEALVAKIGELPEEEAERLAASFLG